MAVDIAMIQGILVAIAFLIGILAVKKVGTTEALVIVGILIASVALPATLAGLPLVGDLFVVVFAIVQGFSGGAIVRLGIELLIKARKKAPLIGKI